VVTEDNKEIKEKKEDKAVDGVNENELHEAACGRTTRSVLVLSCAERSSMPRGFFQNHYALD